MKRARARRSVRRLSHGASMVLVVAIFSGLAMMILLFCLGFTGLIGSYHEQRSAVEAASLAAAKDLSAAAIDDPNFGLVGLSDSGPVGTDTAAGDGFRTSVTGINTLFATIRLDLIIADLLKDPLMKQLALADYNKALVTNANLLNTLTAAVAAGGTCTDANGTVLNPSADATNAYNSNSVHIMVGQTSSLVPNSLKLSLGYVDGLSTRTAIPKPASAASISASQESQGFYVPNTIIEYKGTPFVFAALAPNATLVDFRDFQSNLPDLPYSLATVVKVDADERYLQNSVTTHVVHAVAAAVPGTIIDQRPNPGVLSITFPDGPVAEISKPGDLINFVQLQTDPTDHMQTAATGDYPQTELTNYSMPFLPDADSFHPKFENVFSVALYDWIRRGGTNINVQSLIDMLQTPMNFGAGGGQMQRFHLTASGAVTNDSVPWGKTNMSVSNKQFRAISGLGIVSSNTKNYDLQITDYVHVPGRINGGLHAGEPIDMPGLTTNNPKAGAYGGPSMYENTTWPYLDFLAGGGGNVRPTYNSDGIAVDFTIRMRN